MEAMRKSLVFHMKRGSHWTLHIENMVPDFAKYDGKNMPLKDMVFKREKLFADYKTLVKPDEDTDLAGNAGMYSMHADFNIVMVTNASDKDFDDEIIQMQLDSIPNISEWKKVYILPEE